MTSAADRVYIYIFSNKNSNSTEEKLKTAVQHYCRMTGVVLSGSDSDMQEILQVARAEFGKPYFSHCPQIQFSISHSGEFWVCALADRQIGVDLQEHVLMQGETKDAAAVRFRKMAHRFFHPVEARFVEMNSFRNFFGVWGARESYVKYTGQGIDAVFSEHCVVPANEEVWQEVSDAADAVCWQAQGVWFWETTYRGNYTLCVCTGEQKECMIVENLHV